MLGFFTQIKKKINEWMKENNYFTKLTLSLLIHFKFFFVYC